MLWTFNKYFSQLYSKKKIKLYITWNAKKHILTFKALAINAYHYQCQLYYVYHLRLGYMFAKYVFEIQIAGFRYTIVHLNSFPLVIKFFIENVILSLWKEKYIEGKIKKKKIVYIYCGKALNLFCSFTNFCLLLHKNYIFHMQMRWCQCFGT